MPAARLALMGSLSRLFIIGRRFCAPQTKRALDAKLDREAPPLAGSFVASLCSAIHLTPWVSK